jgi:SAM-dependent methyltransferase
MSSSLYRADLTCVHEAGFSQFAERAAEPLRRELARHGIRAGTVVDLGCGTGVFARALARRGFDVVGVDASAAMIRRARAAASRARFRRASIESFALPRCDAVTALGEVFNYAQGSSRRVTPASHFRRIARALHVGGVLAFDALVDGAPMNYRTWTSGRGWAVLVSVSEDRMRRFVRRDITTFVRSGARYRRRSETHVLRVFRRADLVRDLERAGFSVKIARSYGAVRLAERRLAFIARKTAAPGAGRSRAKA